MPTVVNQTVVTPYYNILGNGGHKIIRLNSGKLYAAMRDGTTSYRIYTSIDGVTWTLFRSENYGVTLNDICLATNGTNIYLMLSTPSSASFMSINESNTVLINLSVDSSQTAVGNVSLAVNPSNGHITGTWASTNAIYPNSYNIRSAKSTDGGATWTKQDGTAGVDQLTVDNAAGTYSETPSVVYMGNGNPIIVQIYYTGSNYYLKGLFFNGSIWNGVFIITGGTTYSQKYPCVVKAPSGRLWLGWIGKDSTDSVPYNVRIKYCDDNGLTWVNGGVSGEKLTTGNNYVQNQPSLTCDPNGTVYVMWDGIDSIVSTTYTNLRRAVWNGSSWTLTTLTSYTTGSGVLYPSALYDPLFSLKFSDPLTIYEDLTANAIKFRGSWISAPAAWCNVGGVWKPAESVHINIGGVWKTVEALDVNIGGAWKQS